MHNPEILTRFQKNRLTLGEAFRGKHHDLHPAIKTGSAQSSDEATVGQAPSTDLAARARLLQFWKDLGIDQDSIESNLTDTDRSGIILPPHLK